MSLRRRLLITLGLSFVILWGLAAAWLYTDLKKQMIHTLDERLAASARMVAGLVAQMPEGTWENAGQPVLSIPRSQGVACQISSPRGQVLMRTHGDFSGQLNMSTPGFDRRVIDGHHWRLFTLIQNGIHITTADRLDERKSLLHNVLLVAAIPFFVALAGSLLVLWFGLMRGLRPLDRLRRELSRRTPDALTPIRLDNAPVELVPAVETLNHLLVRVSDALDREQRLTSDAAHELRTPLTAIKTHVQLAARLEGARAQAALTSAEAGVARLQHTLEQLLLLARVEAGHVGALQQAEVSDIVQAVREDLLDDPRIMVSDPLPRAVVAVPLPLGVAALRNLMSNALQHSPVDGEVRLEVVFVNNDVVLTVSDRGDWPENGDTSMLTRRFWRGAGGQRHVEGSGLGLTLVQAIAVRFGGRLDFWARPGGGLTARLVLPARAV